MKIVKIAAVIVVLMLLGLGIYWKLGGFNAIRFTIEDRKNVKLLGLTYRGTPQDEGMVDTFQKIEKVIQNNPTANLHTIYYTEPAGKLDTLEVFVGIEYVEDIDRIEDLDLITIPCSQVIVADIHANRLVMPSPDTVKEKLVAFAKEKGRSTQGIYIDRIINENSVQVIAPLE